MASHHRGGGRIGGGGRGQTNPNVAQGGRGYGGGRGGQYYGEDGGGRGGGGRTGGGRGFDGRGGGYYHGGRDGGAGGGRGAGGYHGGRDGGAGRGVGGYQAEGGRGRGRGGGGGYHQEGYGGGRGGGGYQEGYGGGRGGGGYQGRGGGRGGGQQQSQQHAILPRAGPPLAERYAADAAALREQFKAMDIRRDEPMIPARPGFGATGTPCVVKANHFFVGLVDKGLHLYDVRHTRPLPSPFFFRQVMSKLVSEKRDTEFGGRLPAYDGRKLLFTAGELPFESKEFEVTLSGRSERRFKVHIKHTTPVSLDQLMMLMAGYQADIPAHALQALDIVLRDIVLNERSDNMQYIAAGRSFFSPHIGRTVNLGLGVEGWKGFYQSIRPTQMGLSVIVDISSTAFVSPLPLINYVKETLNKTGEFTSITDMDYYKLKRILKGLRIEVTHRGDARRQYRIATLTQRPCSALDFESSSGVRKTITEYFRETYRLEIQFGFLPCLQVGTDQKPNYLPMEVCKIVPGQQYRKKLEGQQVSKLMESTCQRPSEREINIRQVVERNDYNSSLRANEFGIEVDYHPTSIQARVLPAPTLKYYGTGSESLCCPKDGQWNMIKKKVVDGAKVGNWACINFCRNLAKPAVDKFCSDLVKWSCNTGVHMDNLKLPVYLARPEQVEADLRMCYQDARNKLRGHKIDLLLAILPEKNGSLYGNIKRICETDIGIMSQCCLDRHVTRAGPPYFANVAIKINAKFGGRNSDFANPQQSLPVVLSKPTIIFGADVTHPAALDDAAPSIASVVASQDWPKLAKYNGIVRAQGHREELINGLEDIVRELLLAFEEGSKQRPQQLIFYRDGVSEGQFKQVLEKEIPEIEKAWKSLYNEKPHITFIVVQKRHHTRLFPDNHNDRRWTDNSGNILAGTVIDKNICHPTQFDFFLCSHAGIKGTSRPTHYHVLRDDNKFTADGLQSLTYNLCYMYSGCTRSVSIAPPAYYAHKLAFRARFYVNQASDVAMSVGSGNAPAHVAVVNPLPQIKNELKRTMFYC
ncbi:hypothetical protein HU200_034113 [Digitaria exilis]|uniref:Uncharacterized protein n=1 Tax=Digitaria exilis TaxID=1010633 RepID=A0A835EK72_9POAL|nr:hypothetical protein HU200_034113 [Digitaria exilis]